MTEERIASLERQLELKDIQISELFAAYSDLKKFVQYGFIALSIGLFMAVMR